MTVTLDTTATAPTQGLDWHSVSRAHLVAPDPHGPGTWHLWVNTISCWDLHYEVDGEFTKYGPRSYVGSQTAEQRRAGIPMQYRWITTGFGAFREGLAQAREWADRLVATTA